MARFRRSHDLPEMQQAEAPDVSFGESPADAATLDSGHLRPPQSAVTGDGAAPVERPTFSDLLPDAHVSERERKREQRLVQAACRGEHSAIEALYRSHYDVIYRYVLLRVGSSGTAEDVTSQVFLGMVRGLGRYTDEGKPFVAWLYGIAQKQIAFHLRTQSRSPKKVGLDDVAGLAAESAGPHASAEQTELRGTMAQALGRLPEGQREVLMLRYVLSLSVAETAAIVGRTEGAVKQLQLRGLASLRGVLGEEGIDLR